MIPGITVTDPAALKQWLDEDEHAYDCPSWNEGLRCCLEKLLPDTMGL